MLRRELIRILALGLLGMGTGALLGLPPGLKLFAAARLYATGIFYAGRSFLLLLGRFLGTCARYQMMSVMFRSLPAAVLSLAVLLVGMVVILAGGWLVGLLRCAGALISAAQLDRSIRDPGSDWDGLL